jgi:aromatic ring-opening dioxygenase catalytic subunit (LigB family)
MGLQLRRGGFVLAAATVHFPYITGWPEKAPLFEGETTLEGFRQLGDAFIQEGIETVIAFTSEHIVNLQPRLTPSFVIGIGEEHRAFPEPHFNLDPVSRKGDVALAQHLVSWLQGAGFDPAHSSELLFDHGTVLPLQLMNIPPNVSIIPIIINSIFKPLPPLARCLALGRQIKLAVDAYKGSRRVALLATGGISHTVGAPGPERNDPDFDTRVMRAMAHADVDALCKISEYEMDQAGNGTHEIRNWVALAGAMHPHRPKVVTALPYVTGWDSGVYQLLWRAHD